jgi:hypothetical protein
MVLRWDPLRVPDIVLTVKYPVTGPLGKTDISMILEEIGRH